MEHYILCIWKGPVLEDQVVITDYFASLLPTSLQYQYSLRFANQTAYLLKPIAKYTTVISEAQCSDDVEWKGSSEELNIIDIILKTVDTDDSANQFASKNFIEQIPKSIHILADQLPAFGTYKLDVLVSSNVLKDVSVSEEPALASAFYRLMRWHSAHFAIFLHDDLAKQQLDEWIEIINADILEKSIKFVLGASLWRGAVQLQTSDNSEHISCPGFELKLDLVENEDEFTFFKSVKEEIVQENSDCIVLSSKLLLIDQCSFASIPSYLMSPLAFRVHLCKPNFMNGESAKFLNYLLTKDEATLILRLGYAKINEKAKCENKYSSNRWKRAVSSGCIKDADTFISTFEDYITFAITKSKESDHVIAFPLREPTSLNANFFFSAVDYKMSNLSHPVFDGKANEFTKNVLAELPVINISLFYKMLEKLKMLRKQQYKNGSFISNPILETEISSLWADVNSISKKLSYEGASLPNVTFEETDPSDWPERMALLWKQMQNDEEKKYVTPNALLGLGSKLSQQTVTFSSEDIRKYFLPTGEPKIETSAETIRPLGNVYHHESNNYDAVVKLEWPEVINCIYHDLYYNSSGQAEEKEAVGNQMVNFYVRYETVSTCNKQQITQNFSVIIPGKSSPAKEFRSPSFRKVARVNRNINERESTECKENTIKDLITKKILSTSRMSCSQNVTRKELSDKIENVRKNSSKTAVKRKSETPVRCSPRKKPPLNYQVNYRAVKRNTAVPQNVKVKKPNELPDLLRRKLRSAVATALENHGINLNDNFFQPCGKRLFTICQAFVQDISQKKGKTSEHLQRIADAHVKQVIEFEKQNKNPK